MPFLVNDTCVEGGVIYFCQGFFSLYDAIHGWMTGRADGWMDGSRDEKASRKMTTTSFTICNYYYFLSYPCLVGRKKSEIVRKMEVVVSIMVFGNVQV
jgi:hypothetical protein